MIKLFIGLIFILIPFLLVIKFRDKSHGFFYVLTGLISFNLIVAILTQTLHIFNYWTIFSSYIFLNVIIFFVYCKRDKKFIKLKESIQKIKIDWVLFLVIIILFVSLYSVHYNYTGKIATINGVEEVANTKINYPYYSDEWGSVSFVKYIINFNSLPFVNPLWKNHFFVNFEFGFSSFLSSLFVLLGLNPLTNYPIFSLFFGMLICLLVYFILRFNHIKKIPAGIASLFIPYIVNSANLPGIWYLIPMTFGTISLLLGFIFISLKDEKMIFLTGLLTLIFYPPFFLLSAISIIFYFISLNISIKDKCKFLGIYFSIYFLFVLIFLFILISSQGFAKIFEIILSKIFYFSFTGNSIPDYSLWKVIPIPILLLSAFGLGYSFFKKKWLSAPLLAGLIYWIAYSQISWRFVIEYQRIVFFSSIILLIFSGFGMNLLFESLADKRIFRKFHIILFLEIILLISLTLFSFSYTSRESWNNLRLPLESGELISPSPPASRFLNEDDLILFNFTEKIFISPPWKGLVIGTATGNYPLDTKDANIGVDKLKYSNLISSNCTSKKQFALDYNIDYVYSSSFDCPNFLFIGKSKENIYLYKFVQN
ncbi:hypothetical protein M0R19_01490 [Candidatus Pacearchaeota archaeon]|nr:hypothetical protein [Candidatus Pacearchaeota archaeon]